jgi:ATP-dependent protease ClpP protease subunit
MKKFFVRALIVFASVVAINAYAAKPNPAPSATPAVTPVVNADGSVVLTADNMLNINTYYDGEMVANLVQKAKVMDSKLPSNEPMYLVINSGGGSIDAGIELIENLNNLHRPVNTLSLWAASMGFQTVQGVKGKRLLTSDGTLMSHKARGGFFGEFPGQLDSRYSYYLKRVLRLDQKAADRTNGKFTLASYRDLIENEYWCDGNDCLEKGFADQVVKPRCDNSLNGTHKQTYDRFLYMGHIIEIVDTFSDCPLQTESLSYQIYIDGEPLFEQLKEKTVQKETSYFGTTTPTTPLAGLSVETAENIKKLVAEKIESRRNNKRDVKKY